jgi:hypothetical protein
MANISKHRSCRPVIIYFIMSSQQANSTSSFSQGPQDTSSYEDYGSYSGTGSCLTMPYSLSPNAIVFPQSGSLTQLNLSTESVIASSTTVTSKGSAASKCSAASRYCAPQPGLNGKLMKPYFAELRRTLSSLTSGQKL